MSTKNPWWSERILTAHLEQSGCNPDKTWLGSVMRHNPMARWNQWYMWKSYSILLPAAPQVTLFSFCQASVSWTTLVGRISSIGFSVYMNTHVSLWLVTIWHCCKINVKSRLWEKKAGCSRLTWKGTLTLGPLLVRNTAPCKINKTCCECMKMWNWRKTLT